MRFRRKGLLSAAITYFLVACTNVSAPIEIIPRADYQPALDSRTLQSYSARLVSQLITHPLNISADATLAIGTFLPANDLSAKGQLSDAHKSVGLQIQESVMTLMSQAGFNVVEVKLREAIKIADNGDRFLSRDIQHLAKQFNLDYVLVGTLNIQQNSTQVNARLINTANKNVIAAATTYMPNNIAWSEEKVQLREGRLIRTDY